ncbi:MAG TPA: biotin/lipoyl-containing protein [Vicinamibacteria bacterium]|nr:biotin/lipoyl-containing protein [Vicinamibacteria bacterium]
MIFEALVEGRALRVEVKGRGDRYDVTVDDRRFEVDWRENGRHFVSLLVDGRNLELGLEARAGGCIVVFDDDRLAVELRDAVRGGALGGKPAAGGPARLSAPMPGKIVRVLVLPGTAVEAGQGLLVMEAMKMENEIRSPRAGLVREIAVRDGQAVETGALLAVVG